MKELRKSEEVKQMIKSLEDFVEQEGMKYADAGESAEAKRAKKSEKHAKSKIPDKTPDSQAQLQLQLQDRKRDGDPTKGKDRDKSLVFPKDVPTVAQSEVLAEVPKGKESKPALETTLEKAIRKMPRKGTARKKVLRQPLGPTPGPSKSTDSKLNVEKQKEKEKEEEEVGSVGRGMEIASELQRAQATIQRFVQDTLKDTARTNAPRQEERMQLDPQSDARSGLVEEEKCKDAARPPDKRGVQKKMTDFIRVKATVPPPVKPSSVTHPTGDPCFIALAKGPADASLKAP